MNKILRLNATNARKNLFVLLDQIVNENIKVILTKEGLKDQILLQKYDTDYKDTEIKDQLKIVRETAGALKTTGYDPNENENARKEFIKEYRKKHDKK